jgi:hypothetical protein
MCCFNLMAARGTRSPEGLAARLTKSGAHVGETGRRRPNKIRDIMRLDSLRVVAAILGLAFLTVAAHPTFAQGNDAKTPEQRAPNGESNKEGPKKIDEYAEAEKLLGGPAANPECMWLGRRVVSLLWRDDLDTAFRHLDLYDRFGCPAGHIQTAFRCVVRQGNIDPKAPDSLAARIHSCWINPNTDPVITPPAAAAATSPSQAQ